MFGKVLCQSLSRRTLMVIHLSKCNSTQGFQAVPANHVNYYTTVSTNQEPLKVKMDNKAFNSLLSPELLQVKQLFDDHGHELRIVGGAVRDLLMGKVSDDLDLCTPALPKEMKDIFEKAGIRILSLAGEKHGTVPIRVNDKLNFEVTTLRVDIKTDGRHAVVRFTTDWRLDALRRDLTVNSLFLDFDGYVHDYFNGIEDLKNRKVRFVNDAETRIKEDYLRILRYFRFYGRIAKHPNRHEDNILKSIKDNAQGLDKISGPRILMELRKIITGNFADSIMKTMSETGVTEHIGLPGSLDLDEFSRVCNNTAKNQPEMMTRMAALFKQKEQLEVLHSRVPLSNKQYSLCSMILEYRDRVNVKNIESITKHYCLNIDPRRGLLKYQMSELCKYQGNSVMATKVMNHKFPDCPVTGNKLSLYKLIRRRYTDEAMTFLTSKWVYSGYTLTENQLMDLADEFIEKYKDEYSPLLYERRHNKKKY